MEGKVETKLIDSKNGENQKSKRESIITKGISRTIQTAKFFSLTITHTATDTIEWESLEEREKKQDNLTKLAIKNFVYTHDTVLDQLKLGEMHAFCTDHIVEKSSDKDPAVLIGFDEMDEVS